MTGKLSLQILVALGYAGMAFSGYLSYIELYGKTAAACALQGGGCNILGFPACVYGFLMFSAVTIIACMGMCAIDKQRKK